MIKVTFDDTVEMHRAFYVLIHNKHPFSGIDMNTILVSEEVKEELKRQNIKFRIKND